MSFVLLPVAVSARSGVTLFGAPDEAQAMDDGVLTHDGDTSRVRLNTQGSLIAVRLSNPVSTPATTARTYIRAAVRYSGVVNNDGLGNPIYADLRVTLTCASSGRVILVGQQTVANIDYEVMVFPFPNDLVPAEWTDLVAQFQFSGAALIDPDLNLTAVELQGVDAPLASSSFLRGVSPSALGMGRSGLASPVFGR